MTPRIDPVGPQDAPGDAFEEPIAACEEDFECDSDDAEAVMAGTDGPSRLTFGMIRRARAALRESRPSPAQEKKP